MLCDGAGRRHDPYGPAPLSIMTVDGIGDMMKSDATERCTESLAEAPLHSIVFGGTSATFLKGIGHDEEIRARMARVSRGIPGRPRRAPR